MSYSHKPKSPLVKRLRLASEHGLGAIAVEAADEIDSLVLKLDQERERVRLREEACSELGGKLSERDAHIDEVESRLEEVEMSLAAVRILRNEDLLRLDAVLGMHEPWPLADVLNKLADGVTHLLRVHGCDAHGHEEYQRARDRALELRAAILSGAVERRIPRYDPPCVHGRKVSEPCSECAEIIATRAEAERS